MIKKMIVPVDFTKVSGQAVKQAVAVAGKAGSSVTLLHVLDDKSVPAGEIGERLQREAEDINRAGCPGGFTAG